MGRRIRFTNFYDHEEKSNVIVYEFFHEHMADYFEAMLSDRNVEYERFFDVDSEPAVTLFGIDKTYIEDSDHCNCMTHAHFRTPLINNAWLKWTMLVITIGMIIFALIGYYKTR